MKKIRVGYDITQVGKKPNSGPNVYWRNLISSIHANHGDRVEIILFRSSAKDDTLDIDTEEVIIAESGIKSYIKLSSYIRQAGCDIIHVNHMPVENLFFYRYRCKKAVTIHGDVAFSEPRLAKRRLLVRQRYGFKLINMFGLFNRIDVFFLVSKSAFNQISSAVDIDPSKVHITHNGIDHDIFKSERNSTDDIVTVKYGLEKNSYILHINNYARKKNTLTLVKAFIAYRKSNPDAFLLVIGRGWDNEEVQSIFKTSGLKAGEAYKIIPGLSNKELPPFYRNAKVFFNPTLHETFGITNLEAMACGCPVISTNKYSVPEVVGDSGLLVDDPYDIQSFVKALDRVHTDNDLVERMVEKGIERSRLFSWKATADKTVQAYHSLINE